MTLDLFKQANPVLYDNKALLMIWNSNVSTLFLVCKVLNSKVQLWYKLSKSHLGLASDARSASMSDQSIDAAVNGNTRILKVQCRAWLIPHYLTPISWPACWRDDCYLYLFSLSSSLFGRKQYWYQPFASVHTFPVMLPLAQNYSDSYYSFWSK